MKDIRVVIINEHLYASGSFPTGSVPESYTADISLDTEHWPYWVFTSASSEWADLTSKVNPPFPYNEIAYQMDLPAEE